MTMKDSELESWQAVWSGEEEPLAPAPDARRIAAQGRRRLVRRMALEVVMAVVWIAVAVHADPAAARSGADGPRRGHHRVCRRRVRVLDLEQRRHLAAGGRLGARFRSARRRALPPGSARGPLRPVVRSSRNRPARRLARAGPAAATSCPRSAGCRTSGWCCRSRRRPRSSPGSCCEAPGAKGTGDARGRAPPVRRRVTCVQGFRTVRITPPLAAELRKLSETDRNRDACGHFFTIPPVSCATAASVVCAAFSPRRKSLSEKVVKTSVT